MVNSFASPEDSNELERSGLSDHSDTGSGIIYAGTLKVCKLRRFRCAIFTEAMVLTADATRFPVRNVITCLTGTHAQASL